MNSSVYIHGYSESEQRRLIRQADILKCGVFAGLTIKPGAEVLELGCGVGAELAIIARDWPETRLTGVDLDPGHLAAARQYLDGLKLAHPVRLVEADAASLPFDPATFDDVITIWFLEHVRGPERVIAEAMRVLKPGGRLILVEVDNATFRFDPTIHEIHNWWDRFCRIQQSSGDPYIGQKLESLAAAAGFGEIHSERLPLVDSRLEPRRRQELLDYLQELLLSGADTLMAHGQAERSDIIALRAAFTSASADPAVQFQYHAIRVICNVGARRAAPLPSATDQIA